MYLIPLNFFEPLEYLPNLCDYHFIISTIVEEESIVTLFF